MSYSDSIQALLEAKEGERIQFKEAKSRFDFGEAVKCCCALANNGGGKLVFGITDKRPRSVVGSLAFAQPERTRMGLIEKLKVNVDFQILSHEGKRVLVFDVNTRTIRWRSVDLRGRHLKAHAGRYAPSYLRRNRR